MPLLFCQSFIIYEGQNAGAMFLFARFVVGIRGKNTDVVKLLYFILVHLSFETHERAKRGPPSPFLYKCLPTRIKYIEKIRKISRLGKKNLRTSEAPVDQTQS